MRWVSSSSGLKRIAATRRVRTVKGMVPCWSVSLAIQVPCGPSMARAAVARWIRGRRQERGWSRRDAAQRARVAASTWRAWESVTGPWPAGSRRWRLLTLFR